MQSLFTKFIRKKHKQTAVWELKITKTKSLPFSRIEPHQITSLKKAKHACIYHKISDQSAGFKPFDAFQICHSPAFLVILFYKQRQPKITYWIDIDDLLHLIKSSKRKSITEEQAKQLATYIYEI